MPAQQPARKKKKRSWRDAFGPEETLQRVRPVESGEYLRNPHKGTTTFQRFNGDPLYPGLRWDDRTGPTEFKPFKGDPQKLRNRNYPCTTLSYCRWLWSVLEPEQGKYRWDIIEGALKAAAERGQTLQARVQPYITNDIPEWYWTNGGKVLTSASRGGVKVPDNNAPAYLELWGGFIRAFAARFDGHPNLESFDVAYAGPCGEMGGNCTPAVAAKLVDVYLHGFRKTQLVSMVGTHGCKYAAGLKGYHLGWRGDCFGDLRSKGRGAVPDGLTWNHMYDEYPEKVFTDGVQDAWKTAPVTLETCWVVGHWYNEGWNIDWILDWGLRYHASVFMPKSCAIPGEWADKVEAFNRRLGYQFILRQVMVPLETPRGKPFNVDVSLENGGVAPIYRSYALALRFRQGRTEEVVPMKVDVRTWLPGPTWFSERLKLPESLEAGEAKLDIGIIDPKTKKAVVRFAAKGLLKDGWLPMTRIDVV